VLAAVQKKGQRGEREGLSHTHTNISRFWAPGFKKLSGAVQEWYESGCTNPDLENILIGFPFKEYSERPRYENL